MVPTQECHRILSQIIDLLETGGDRDFALAVRSELAHTVESLDTFLISNELWGGSGSLADSAFAEDWRKPDLPNRAQNRAAFERLMIQLGRIQMSAGHVNVRTQMWVEAFEHWRDSGIR